MNCMCVCEWTVCVCMHWVSMCVCIEWVCVYAVSEWVSEWVSECVYVLCVWMYVCVCLHLSVCINVLTYCVCVSADYLLSWCLVPRESLPCSWYISLLSFLMRTCCRSLYNLRSSSFRLVPWGIKQFILDLSISPVPVTIGDSLAVSPLCVYECHSATSTFMFQDETRVLTPPPEPSPSPVAQWTRTSVNTARLPWERPQLRVA